MTSPDVQLNGSLSWEPFDIPGGSEPVAMALLRKEPETRARVLVVRFPAGWKRLETGWYETSEELIVVHGTLRISGMTFADEGWAFLPAGWLRTDMAADTEVLAFARFGGPARWTPGETSDVGGVSAMSLREQVAPDATVLGARARGLNPEGTSWLLADVPAGPNPGAACELLDLESWTWRVIGPGEQVPATRRAFVRIP